MHRHKEKTALITLSFIMSVRMLGLFMILPVFSVYAANLPHATNTLVGLALGIYGFTQALLQIPLGMLSDHFGRKPIIMIGLFLLLIGSIIAAITHSIYFLLLGRALQGAGAIGSTVLALLADLTRDESRSKAMAFMGLSIGFAFMLAMIIGPILNHWYHLSGIFWITGLLAIIGMGLLLFAIPKPPMSFVTENTTKILIKALKNRQLSRLYASIFFLHAILTALFVAIPIVLTYHWQLTSQIQIAWYFSILIFAFTLALPLIIIAEKKQKIRPLFVGAVGLIAFIMLILSGFYQNKILTGLMLLAFFTAFTLLEAMLPSLVSKISPIASRGGAMGIYSTCQFLGIFIGGLSGGIILSQTNLSGVFLLCALIAFLWLGVIFFMQQPLHLSTLFFHIAENTKFNDNVTQLFADRVALYQSLTQLPGIAEVVVSPQENLLTVKIDKQKISEYELRNILRQGNL